MRVRTTQHVLLRHGACVHTYYSLFEACLCDTRVENDAENATFNKVACVAASLTRFSSYGSLRDRSWTV